MNGAAAVDLLRYKKLGRNFKVEKLTECQVAARSDPATDRPTETEPHDGRTDGRTGTDR